MSQNASDRLSRMCFLPDLGHGQFIESHIVCQTCPEVIICIGTIVEKPKLVRGLRNPLIFDRTHDRLN